MNQLSLIDHLKYKYYRKYRPEFSRKLLMEELELSWETADEFERQWQAEMDGTLVFLNAGCTVPAYVILEG